MGIVIVRGKPYSIYNVPQFLADSMIAIVYGPTGDLSGRSKEEIEAICKNLNITTPKHAAGQIYRFITELEVGTIIMTPSKTGKKIYIGRIISEYYYEKDNNCWHVRKVEWLMECWKRYLPMSIQKSLKTKHVVCKVNDGDKYITMLINLFAEKDRMIEIKQKDIDTLHGILREEAS